MDKLKLCPFCQLEFELVETVSGHYMVKHDVDCPIWSDGENGQVFFTLDDVVTALNTRPIEDTLRERTRWIPVSERLPDIGVSVLVIGKNVVCGIARHVNLRLYSHDCKGWHTPVGICLPGTVTHWMPLPEPPESA